MNTSSYIQRMDATQNQVQKMELASRNIDNSLLLDNNSPRLLDFMNLHPQSGSTASGFADHDYPTLSGGPHIINNMTQIKCINSVPLPSEIVDHFARILYYKKYNLLFKIVYFGQKKKCVNY